MANTALSTKCPRAVMRFWSAASLAVLSVSCACAQQTDPDDTEIGVRGHVRRESALAKLVPAELVEQKAIKDYRTTLEEANRKSELVAESDIQVIRLRAIARRMIPYAGAWNQRANQWNWEVHLLRKDETNAFCMPGGKIVFLMPILSKLQLTDDEAAIIMGHEIAHALREHGRKHIAQGLAMTLGTGAISSVLGLRTIGQTAVNQSANLLSLRFSRGDESEADIVGLDLAARAGYDPRAGVTLWRKMADAAKSSNKGPEFRSTHPSEGKRADKIEELLPAVMPLYRAADKPDRVYGPPLR